MSANPRTRGPYAKSAEKRALLARTALDVIQEVGHAALTTAEVARRAGVSERSLFYHFPTRDHLLVAALDEADADTRSAMDDRYGPGAVDDPGRFDIDEVITVLSLRDADRPWKIQLAVAISALAQDPAHPAHDYARRHYDDAIGQFAELMRGRQAAGLAHPELDPVSIARRLIAVWDGLQAQWLVDPRFDLATEVQETFRQLSGQNVMAVRQALDDVMTGITAADPVPAAR